ncbi:MAG: cyclase family protein [Leucobacter sp.]
MRLVDLTQPLRSGMPVYPGDPEVAVGPASDVAADGVAVSYLRLGSHTGTHLDAPAHVIAGGRTVDRIPLDRLCGPARVLRIEAGPGERIGIADLPALPRRLPRIVCVASGWDRAFGQETALRHPHLGLECAEELWARGARVLAVDTMSPDASWPPGASDLPVHRFWLGGDGVIVENLTRLTELPETAEVCFLPLLIAGGDGAPVRAFARAAPVRQQR